MKKISTTILATLFATVAFNQTAIVIDSASFQIPSTPVTLSDLPNGTPKPTIGINQNWDYTSFSTSNPGSYIWADVETDSFFKANEIDYTLEGFKNLTSLLGYRQFQKLDFTGSAVDEKGLFIPKQDYSISALTGNSADSINIPEQKILLSNPRRIYQFPMSAGSTWASTSRREVDLNFTITAGGLNNELVKHVYYTIRKDSIIGWGKVRVQTPTGPSIAYDVLLQKESQYNIDSFFIGGNPADSTLLAGFGIKQGQRTGVLYRKHFYQKGSYVYLIRFNYGTDSTYSTLTNAFINTTNLTPAPSAINESENFALTTVLYPNPSNGDVVNLKTFGKSMGIANYTISDLLGKTIQSAKGVEAKDDELSIRLDEQFSKGLYVLHVTDQSGNTITKEQFAVIR